MLKKETALQIQKRALNAIVELNSIILDVQDDCPEKDLVLIKNGVGSSMGVIQMEIPAVINSQYPEIDDLAE